MKTISLDTSIILDFFLQRTNSPRVRNYFLQARNNQIVLHISLIVVLEIDWVLRSYYDYKKTDIIPIIRKIMAVPNCEIPDKARVNKALLVYEQTPRVNFDDCLIALEAIDNKCADLATSDQQLLKLYRKLK